MTAFFQALPSKTAMPGGLIFFLIFNFFVGIFFLMGAEVRTGGVVPAAVTGGGARILVRVSHREKHIHHAACALGV